MTDVQGVKSQAWALWQVTAAMVGQDQIKTTVHHHHPCPSPWKTCTFSPRAPILIQNRKIESKVFGTKANSSAPEEQNAFALDFFNDPLFAHPVPEMPALSSLYSLPTWKKDEFGVSWELAHTVWLLGHFPEELTIDNIYLCFPQ